MVVSRGSIFLIYKNRTHPPVEGGGAVAAASASQVLVGWAWIRLGGEQDLGQEDHERVVREPDHELGLLLVVFHGLLTRQQAEFLEGHQSTFVQVLARHPCVRDDRGADTVAELLDHAVDPDVRDSTPRARVLGREKEGEEYATLFLSELAMA